MGVEVAESQSVHVPAEAGSGGKSSVKENGTLYDGFDRADDPIVFGSHVSNGSYGGEVQKDSQADVPKEAVEFMPEPKQNHAFFIAKIRFFEDSNIKSKLDQAEKELAKRSATRSNILEKLRGKKAERAKLIEQKKLVSAENNQYRSIIDEKRKEMEPLQQALGKLRGQRGSALCSSEEELDGLIRGLEYRIQHESITLNEERQLVREIKQLKGTREKVIANAAERAKIQDSMGEKDTIQSQVKLIGGDLDGVRKEQQAVRAKIKQLDEEIDAISKEVKSLEEEMTAATEKREESYNNLTELRRQRGEGNAVYFENRGVLNQIKELAAKKEIEALKELSETENGKFVSIWTSSSSFRDDYMRRISSSLNFRQMSKDVPSRKFDEKSESVPDTAAPALSSLKPSSMQSSSEHDASTIQKTEKERTYRQPKEVKTDSTINTLTASEIDDREEIAAAEKLRKNSAKKNEVDEERMREMKREEEIAKAKQAMERKKKLAEKAATKAALKAQKEAEKKLKEREKKLRKKVGATVPSPDAEEPVETVADVEPEKPNDKVETVIPSKNKERKESTVRSRVQQNKPDVRKALIKRKKSMNYWIWAAPAALIMVLLVVVGYNYLL